MDEFVQPKSNSLLLIINLRRAWSDGRKASRINNWIETDAVAIVTKSVVAKVLEWAFDPAAYWFLDAAFILEGIVKSFYHLRKEKPFASIHHQQSALTFYNHRLPLSHQSGFPRQKHKQVVNQSPVWETREGKMSCPPACRYRHINQCKWLACVLVDLLCTFLGAPLSCKVKFLDNRQGGGKWGHIGTVL